MTFAVRTDAPPLREDADGALRVGHSRVLLELVIRAFQDGATPESIVQRYPTVTLIDTYGAIAYYLRHRKEVEDYLRRRERLAEESRQRIEAVSGDLSELRARLQAAIMHRTIVTAILVICLASQAGCARFEHPLVELEMCHFDPGLVGGWKLSERSPEFDKANITYLFIGAPKDVKNRPKGLMALHSIAYESKIELSSSVSHAVFFFPATVGGDNFLQFVEPKDDKKTIETWQAGDVKSIVIWKYQIKDDRLTLWPVIAAVNNAVKTGELKGTLDKNKVATITEPTESLHRYFASEKGKRLFDDKTRVVFERLK